MKKLRYIIFIFAASFLLLTTTQAATATLSTNKSSVVNGATFITTVNVLASASWNVHVNASGPVSGCIINQVNVSDSAMNVNQTFSVNCTTTGIGTITLTLSGDVSDEGGAISYINGSKMVSVVSPPPSPSNPTPSAPAPSSNNTNSSTPSVNNMTSTEKSNDALLKDIKLNSGVLNFDSNTTTYDVTVGFDIKKIEIKGITNNDKAQVKIAGDTNLKLGINTFKIKVTSEDGVTVKEYIINVTRSEKILNKNSKLKSLKINNYNFKFDKNKTNYKLHISNEDSLTIEALVANELSKYEIIGNKNLKNGSVIRIKVTAEDGTSTIYKINIEKGFKKDNSALTFSLIVNFILIIVIVYISYNSHKNNYNIWKFPTKKKSIKQEKTEINIIDNKNGDNTQSLNNNFNLDNNVKNNEVNSQSFNTQINNSYFDNTNDDRRNQNY